jgi:hypothetical protein
MANNRGASYVESNMKFIKLGDDVSPPCNVASLSPASTRGGSPRGLRLDARRSISGTLGEQIEQILKGPEVDCAVDCVGFEAKQKRGAEQPATVLNQLMGATHAAGRIVTSGLYVTPDPGAEDEAAAVGNLSVHFRTSIARPGSLARNLEGKGLWNRLP